MNSCKLLVYYPEDFKSFSGTVQSTSPMIVSLQGVELSDFDSSISIKLKWYDNAAPVFAYANLKSAENSIFTFELLTPAQPDNQEIHFIEFRDFFEIAKFDPQKTAEIRHRVDKINNRYRSNLTTQIRKIITDETLTNQYIFKLLMQVDAKLDELLDSIKTNEDMEGLVERKMFSLGGSGMSFLYDGGEISVGDQVYVQSMPRNGIGLNFATICTVNNIIPSPKGSICESEFVYIDESTRENVIHYIFQKDREHLKRIRH